MDLKWKYLMTFLMLTVFILDTVDIDAQRRTRTRRGESRAQSQETVPVNQKIWYGLGIGNLGIGSNSFGFSLKGLAGYKFTRVLSAGLSGKFFYNSFSGAQSLFSYGTGVFARASVLNNIYLHGEYNLTSYDNTNRDTYTYPMLGAGYESGFGPWTGGLMILVNLDANVRDLPSSDYVEYWITFNYNFMSNN